MTRFIGISVGLLTGTALILYLGYRLGWFRRSAAIQALYDELIRIRVGS